MKAAPDWSGFFAFQEVVAALAQDTRMSIYRLLFNQASNSRRASEISENLRIVPSTLSGHLAILKQTGLLQARNPDPVKNLNGQTRHRNQGIAHATS